MGDYKSIFFVKKKALTVVAVSFTMLTCMGCGAETVGVSTVSVDKEGKVSSVLYEDFDKDYYSLDELKSMADDEIAGYNSE